MLRPGFGSGALWPRSVFSCQPFYYYLPSFTDYSDGQGLITYFGISQVEYLGGAFESLPALIDRPLSWLSLAG